MKYLIYYDPQTKAILDLLPLNTPLKQKRAIQTIWQQEKLRKILIYLTYQDNIPLSTIKNATGLTQAALHTYVDQLQQAGLIHKQLTYKGNRQHMITSDVLSFHKNTPMTQKLKETITTTFLQHPEQKKILNTLNNNYQSLKEIADQTKLTQASVRSFMKLWQCNFIKHYKEFNSPIRKQTRFRQR